MNAIASSAIITSSSDDLPTKFASEDLLTKPAVISESAKCVSDRTVNTVLSSDSFSETETSDFFNASPISMSASMSLSRTMPITTDVQMKAMDTSTSSSVVGTVGITVIDEPLLSPIKHKDESFPIMNARVNSLIDSPAITSTTSSITDSSDDGGDTEKEKNGDTDDDIDDNTEGTDMDLNGSYNSNLSAHSSIVLDGALRNLISSTDKALSMEEREVQKEITRPFIHTPITRIEDADDHVWNEVRHLRNSEDSMQHEIDFAVDQIAYGHAKTRDIQDIVCETSFQSQSLGCSKDEDEVMKVITEGANHVESFGKFVFGTVKKIICCEDGQEKLMSSEHENGDYVIDSKMFESPYM